MTERFRSNGLHQEDQSLGCFMCGQHKACHHSITATVQDDESAIKIVGMFKQGAKKIDHNRVEIEACDCHLLNLAKLEAQTIVQKRQISPEIIQSVQNL